MNLTLHKPELQSYHPNWHHGIPRRIAYLLHDLADQHPGQLLSYASIAQIVLGLSTPLGRRSRLVRRIRDDVHRARKLLTEKFGRDLITTGTAARATVDGAETFEHRIGKDLYRVVRRLHRLRQTIGIVKLQGFDEEKFPEMALFLTYAEARLRSLSEPTGELVAALETIRLALAAPKGQLALPSVEEAPKRLAS